MVKNKKVLVTGGAGFIGSHLVERLCVLGYEVVVLDDFSTGKKENLTHCIDDITLIEGSITSLIDVERAMDGVDIVFHQAAVASVPKTIEDPLGTHEINITGTLNIFNTARRIGAKVIYASSCAVFGNEPSMPKSELSQTMIVSPYALHKLTNEHYAKVFGDIYNLKTVGLRYFNVFGPRQDPSSPYSGVISIFVERAQKELPITLFGDGTTTRDFIFVDDVIDANIKAAEQDLDTVSSIFTIGTGIETSLNTVVQVIQEVHGSPLVIEYAPERLGDIRRSVADSTRASQKLSWKAQTSFLDGMKKIFTQSS